MTPPDRRALSFEGGMKSSAPAAQPPAASGEGDDAL